MARTPKKSAKKSTISIIDVVGTTKTVGEVATIPGGKGVELHSLQLPGWMKSKKDVDFGEFLQRWQTVRGQVGTMMTDLAKQSFGKMTLDEVEVSIGVSGEGSIGIVTAKAEASIIFKFKKE
jgi:hypothetical protein